MKSKTPISSNNLSHQETPNYMKTATHQIAVAMLLSLNLQLVTFAQGTAFTYQGRLNSAASPVNGNYDLTFTLFNTNTTGVAIAGPVTNSATAVDNGLFTTVIDFGAGIITDGTNWLEIAVRTNGGGSFSTLAPRQQLTPAPFAITALGLAGVVENNTIGAGQFATVGGGSGNTSTNAYATVSGGYSNIDAGYATSIGGGAYNVTSNDYATVAGGLRNSAGYGAAVGGGFFNIAGGFEATVGGGYNNTASDYWTTVGGGFMNTSSGYTATVGGGYQNTSSGYAATVSGGQSNLASGDYSFAAGNSAQALHPGSFVWADGNGGSFASTANNQFSVRAAGGVVLAGDVQLEGGAAYHHLELSGGNSIGYLYGAYPYYGDGIHLGYNFYSDAAGNNHVINPGGGTSRISARYGSIELATSIAPGLWPNTWVLLDSAGRLGIDRTPTANVLEVGGNASKSVAGSWLANSDARIKTGIATVTNALETLNQVRLVSFRYTDSYRTAHSGIYNRSYLNVVAQEFARVFPDYVKGSGEKLPDGSEILQVDSYPLTIYSAAAIQELSQKMEAGNQQLREELKRLNAQNAELTRSVTELKELVSKLVLEQNGGGR
jgi:hypothetical protein